MLLAMVRQEVAPEMGEQSTRLRLGEIYESFDMPGLRAELLDERLIVNPMPIKLHNRVVTWLTAELLGLCAERDWDLLAHGAVELAKTSDKVQPDLFSAHWTNPSIING